MGFIPHLARSFGLVLLVAGAAAHAEVMHMPFDCHFDGARVLLRPSPERTYPIIGRHEREIFTACSPMEPDMCRNWFVHRFDFDCEGDRVAWIDAAAAASRISDWDAWIENGRFHMRMNHLWGVARARPLGPRRRWMRRRYRDHGDAFVGARGGNGPRVVAVRSGFAPAVGIPLTFSGEPPDVAYVASPPAQEAPAVAAYAAQSVPPPIPELPERAPPKEQRLAASAPVVAPAPTLVTKNATTQEAHPVAVATESPATNTASGNAPNTAEAPGFTIINAPHSAAAEPPAQASEISSNPAEPIETAAVTAGAERDAEAALPATDVAPPVAEVALPVSPGPDAPPSVSAPHPRAVLRELSPETAIAAAATTLALAGLALFGIRRRRRRQFEGPNANRDIADISLDGGHAMPRLSPSPAPSKPEVAATENLGHQVSDDAETNALPVPTTYAEALEVLGASSDASTSAIKKIVDGLRQSWHPDLARSEADRLRREARVRQINVAWDIVSAQRSAA